MIDNIPDDLADARAKIERARDELRAVMDGQEPPEAMRRVIAQLDRMAAEVEGVEEMVRPSNRTPRIRCSAQILIQARVRNA